MGVELQPKVFVEKLGNIKNIDPDFAHDAAIQSESMETLVVDLNAFSNETKPLSLETWVFGAC